MAEAFFTVAELCELLRFFRLVGPFLVETIDTAIRDDGALLASIERMALGAGIDTDFIKDRTGFEGVAAVDAGNLATMVIRMNAFFHISLYSFRLDFAKPDCVFKYTL